MSAATRLAELLPETKQLHGEARLLTPTTNPIPLLNNPLARLYTHIHTAQLCLYYYMRSGALVTAPLETLLQDLIPLTLSQFLFCAICLAPAGSWNSGTEAKDLIRGTASSSTSTPTKSGRGTGLGTPSRKRLGPKTSNRNLSSTGLDNPPWSSRITSGLISLILAYLLPPVPLMVLALVLGAPLYPTSLLPHTLALATHVSLITTTPIFFSHGVSSGAWRDVAAVWLPFDESGVWGGTVGCFVGAWMGAVPMALDWDREWQKWPCTVLWGALLGWAIGRLVASSGLGFGRRIDLGVSVEPSKVDGKDADVKKVD